MENITKFRKKKTETEFPGQEAEFCAGGQAAEGR
jgi:hypothetical protein